MTPHAVLQGRSINGLVLELIRAVLATSTSAAGGHEREEFVAELFRRAGVDPVESGAPGGRRPDDGQHPALRRRPGPGPGEPDERAGGRVGVVGSDRSTTPRSNYYWE